MLKLFATCPKGLEYLLRDELAALGAAESRESLAGVHFSGSLEVAYRACLWSRLASRILMPLAEFDAASGEALYDGVAAVDFSAHMAAEASFAIDANGATRGVTHSHYAVQRVKDAIVDQFRQQSGVRPSIDTERPSVRFNLLLRRERGTLSLDLSGAPLHQRGWRDGHGKASLKENLAAAMLLRAGWPEIYAAGGSLVDPMCGSGTLLVEAAWMAADVAPGWKRDYYGLLGWRGHDSTLWESLRAEVARRAQAGLSALPSRFFGFDQDPAALNDARHNVQRAGVSGFVHLGRQSVDHLKRPQECDAGGLVIVNPPYGQRLGDRERLVPTYRTLGERLASEFTGWRASVITSEPELGRAIGLRAVKRYALYNGAIECQLLNFDLAEQAPAEPRTPKPLSAGARMLKNRLEKNRKHLRKKLEREDIHCYRLYDADLPEYAAAIDVYGEHVHIQEYQAPASIAPDVAQQRLREIVRVVAETLQVPRDRIALKQRYRGKGGEKYGRMDQRGEFIEVSEGGLSFLVNLWDYLDTGLFLDHRPLRGRVRELARGTRFLNLFCYTGAVSVYAAAGGAASTTSVDLSTTYLEWASRNLALNGFVGNRHRLVQADAVSFLEHDQEQYDLIFVDPPTFSNSKRADDFDVQRDHVRLLNACAKRLSRDGLLIFSNNFRRFQLDEEALSAFRIREISAATIPFDFERDARIHRAWELRHA
ncbi:bifunctional 23S rRNA (guanine(2069)-N(7))-methyltransferase RlmK/23S rRNA (guanine(2445)-N(2))-methyltransferase RlmL [Tahibacter amnicola]|uniref:Ribosomal RNA large subunit methyltransferase K/L n=1 Tax=Tahibacter amnicola TaxID=2976241 RepID=A0ABY6BIN1_9GAMM|nr:bifunctional 23S rRNA (guanine(2069)-N(7))-methyltransferase RlmK/23S rRNA (guanine(2445)-N(2))-methyltransferase RlmL [Tahibacter amnicola]UXI69874.1 bifunctional 23S rRNA (guanine(2069)-N(7))-methyltransferase RlmK/23S rRNA (guanine(2445)-N(2))-methyltransferase RlmL [Tahibacter amnicola]